MEVQFGPNSVDEPNLLYKLQHKIKVFKTVNALPNRGYNLVTSSSKYGLVFVASPDGILSVYYLNQLIDKECEPQNLPVNLQEKPTHVAVSCDQELLAVTGCQLLSVYKITDFQNQNASPVVTIKFDVNPSTFVSSLQWNPCIPDSIAIAFYDGTLLACQVSANQVKKVPSKARCICWSPKGKQLVTGNSDGTLCQYKPDLTPAKMVPAPNLFEGAPVEALAIYWISTFQFAVVYKNAADNSRPAVTIINTPKAGQPNCVNYEDICYSMGTNRPWYYYLQGIAQWNIILSSSSNSMELGTMGSADGVNWSQWCQPDEARLELPLTDKKQENYPVGVCFDTCAIHQLPWGENQVLPHMPLLLVISQTGHLTVFNVINLKKEAAQICTPPQQLVLPAAAMSSAIPDFAPSQPAAPPPTSAPVVVQPKPLPAQPALVVPAQVQAVPPASQFQPAAMAAKPLGLAPQVTQCFGAVPIQQVEQKPLEIKPAVTSQPQPVMVQLKPTTATPKPQPAVQIQENAALKAEQERINKMKANQELKNMLVKEVNDFQQELYKFTVKTRETQARLQRDIDTMISNFNFSSMDPAQLKKDCSLEELRAAIVQLKLELVRACAVVAEARTRSQTDDLNQWTQADPLTTKRVASVKKLAYYVQTQLEQALNCKWNEISSKDLSNKPGQRMIRPILDDVYQPLVKQQEILSRQQAVLKTLRNTLKECDISPMFKSTSLLRNTPFRNKDPLSKLTKNILNMSIEPQNKAKDSLLTAQKLDALRDMLSNHKTVKIKPVNVELRQHLADMKLNYEKSMKDKALSAQQTMEKVTVKVEADFRQQVKTASPVTLKTDLKSEPIKQLPISVPSFTPVNNLKSAPGLGNVARTLFSEDIKQDQKHLVQPSLPLQPTAKTAQIAFVPTSSPPIAINTRSVLKDLLQNKSQANLDAKNDSNTFMGQNICSPTSFAFSGATSIPAAPSTVFTSKPISDINNMFSKFQSQPFVSETKPQKNKSDETGELEAAEAIRIQESKIKADNSKPITNLFAMKTTVPFATSTPMSNVPDVLKSHTQDAALKSEHKTVQQAEKAVEKSKENVPETSIENVVKALPKVINEKKETASPLSAQVTNKSSLFCHALPQQVVTSLSAVTEIKSELKAEANKVDEVKVETKSDPPKGVNVLESTAPVPSSASSVFAVSNASAVTAPKPEPGVFASTLPALTPKAEKPDSDVIPPSFGTSTSSSASSLFEATVASQLKTTPSSGSIFSTTPTTPPSSVFGSASQGSLFGTAPSTQSPTFSSSNAQDISKPSVFSTATPASPSSVFGTATSTTPSNLFGTAASVFAGTSTTQSSVFGSSTTASVFGSSANSQASVFGGTTTPSVFGTVTTTPQVSVFGSTAATTTPSAFTSATTSASIFATTATTSQSLFGKSTATTQSSVFRSPTSTSASVFGTSSASPASVFGGASSQAFGAPTPSTQASVFGTPTQTPPASVFGTPTQTTQASVFGTPTQTTQASVFGTPPASAAQSGSLFGNAEANLFASASISTTSAPSQSSGGSIFSGGSSGSVFGSNNTNVFGGKSAFGQSNTSAATIFGGGGAAFAQKPASSFWSGGNNASSGGFTSGFGQTATTQASSIFGGASGGSFSTPTAGGSAFGSPQQASAFGTAENKPSVFGSPQQQAAPAFGGSSVFSTQPAFGQSTSSPPSASAFGGFGGFNKSSSSGFGAPAAFGGGASFGGTAFGNTSPGKVFGGGAAAPNFSSPTQSNATFESLATQNTLTFGNLAQQSPQPQQQAPTFNTSPSFTGWRG